jgi:hypothetical protein
MMSFRVDVHHHFDDGKLDEILKILKDVRGKEEAMSKELDSLTAEVQATVTLEQSAITLINGLAAQIVALKDDPAALQALSESLTTQATALSVAITANTPPAA